MGILSFLFKRKNNFLKEVLDKGATIIDVRSLPEFKSGHISGSVNIPLNQLNNKLNKIKKLKQPLVVCCASGIRSASARNMLKSKNITEVYNGGSWMRVNRLLD